MNLSFVFKVGFHFYTNVREEDKKIHRKSWVIESKTHQEGYSERMSRKQLSKQDLS